MFVLIRGSAIARIIGENVKLHSHMFHELVRMWVYEERIEGRNLTEIINSKHENVKYLPGYKLPSNIIADPDIGSAVEDATM